MDSHDINDKGFDDSQIGSGKRLTESDVSVIPIRQPTGYPPQAKRHRPMYEFVLCCQMSSHINDEYNEGFDLEDDS